MQSIIVPAHVADSVEKRLNKLAAKARVTVTRIPGTTYLKEGEGFVSCARFTLGDMPRIAGGWALVARIEHTTAGNLVSVLPGECVSPTWRTAEPVCSHCNTKRARRDTFVLRAPDGALRSIGRNCLADFLVADPAELVARAELAAVVSTPNEEDYRRGGGGWEPSTIEYLSHVCAAVRVEGFRKAGSDGNTRDRVSFSMGMPPAKPGDLADWRALQPAPEDKELAARLVAWSPEGTGDYIHNLRVALALPSVGRTAGLLCSAPTAYARAMGDHLARPKAAAVVSEHFGTLKARGMLLLRLIRVTDTESDWGNTRICAFEDSAGRLFTWFASGAAGGICAGDVGAVFVGKGTIKAHTEFKGRKQTTLTRFACERADQPCENAA